MNVASGFGRYQKLLEPMPPVGVAFLAATLREAGFHVDVLDAFAEQIDVEETVRRIVASAADLVGISCLTPSAQYTLDLAARLRAESPQTKIALGNLHASLFAADILQTGTVDAVGHGEGERTIVDLARWAAGEKALADIPGISYRENGTTTDTPPAPLIDDLDALPFPDWRGLPYRRYGLLPFATIAKPALTLAGSRGCPYRCKFCSLQYIGRPVRKRSAARIVEEILHLTKTYGARQVAFVDAYFPFSEKQGLAFCEEVHRVGREKIPTLLTQLRVDVVTPTLMRELRRAGMRRVMFGIESGSQDLLDSVGKSFSIQQARDGVRIAREAGVETVGFFIFGLPGDTPAYARQTIRFSKELGLDFAKFSMFVPFPGSIIYEALVEKGELDPKDWRRFTTFNPKPDELPYVPPGMTPDELAGFQHRGTSAFYLRPKTILNLLFRIRTIPLDMVWSGARALALNAWQAIASRFVKRPE